MGLQEEIDKTRAEIRSDGYAISVGEWISIYEKGELDIHPEFQRFFRWSLRIYLRVAGSGSSEPLRNRSTQASNAPAAPLKGTTAVCHNSTCSAWKFVQ